MIAENHWTYFIVSCCLLGSGWTKDDRGNSATVQDSSKELGSPQAFWPVSSSSHGSGADAGRLYATLYYANISQGEGASEEAVQFEGTSRSYLEISNDGRLDSSAAYSWQFNIYPEISQEAVILEYHASSGINGVQLKQDGDRFKATIFDASGTYSDVVYSDSGFLSIGSWNFVGFNYIPAYQDVDFIKGTNLWTYGVDLTIANAASSAFGDVRIGSSPSGGFPFKGKIGCIQFYDLALVDKALNLPSKFCDPAVWVSGHTTDWTQSYVPTTTTSTTAALTTTTIVLTSTTTPLTTPTTTPLITPMTNPTTTTTTTPTTTPAATTTTTVTQTTTPAATSPPPFMNALVSRDWPTITEQCFTFTKIGTKSTFDLPSTNVIFERNDSSLVQCVLHCSLDISCSAFTISIGNVCRITDDLAFPLLSFAQSDVYSVQRN